MNKKSGVLKDDRKSKARLIEELRAARRKIAALQRRQAALKVDEISFRLFFNNSGDAVLLAQPDGTILAANPEACRMFGRSEKEITKIGRSGIVDLQDPRLPAAVEERRRTGLLKGELNYKKKDGTVFPCDITSKIFRDSSGSERTITIIQDLTERKRVEEQLRENEEKLRVLFEKLPIGVSLLDQNRKLIYANPALEKILAISRDDLLKGKYQNRRYIRPDGTSMPSEEYASMRVFQKLQPVHDVETGVITESGKTIWTSVSAAPFGVAGKGVVIATVDITERKQTEEALTKSEEKFRSLTENVNLGIYRNTAGPEGKFIEANPAIIGMFGYKSKKKFLATNVSDLYHNAADRKKFNNRMLREGFVKGEELQLKKKDGSLFIGSVSAVAVKDGQGYVRYYDGIIDDITERKRMEDVLRFTRLSLDNAADTMVCISRDGRFADINNAFCSAVGYSRGELLSMTVHDIDPDYQAEMWSGFWERLKQAGTLTFETRHRTKDGRVFPVEITATFFEHNGKEYHCGFARDITERKKAEVALQSSEIRCRELFENINSGVAVYTVIGNGHDFIFKDFNRAGEIIDHDQRERLIGKSIFEVRPGVEQFGLIEVFRQVWQTGEPAYHPVCLYQDEKLSGWYENFVYKLPSGEIVAVFEDITERKRGEEALRKSESQLRALSLEMSLVEERERKRLAMFLHDEIGQSLALLRMKFGNLAGVLESKSGKQNIQQIRDLLEKAIEQTHTLTFELSPPVLHQLGLEAAIEWAGEKISQDFGIEFMFSDDGMIKPLSADIKALLFRCVRELMLNTVKHAKAKRLTVSLTRREERVFVVVEDDGVGFDMSLPGGQSENVGFGLFSVRERLGATGGSYELQSEPGRGTRTTLSVPLEEERPAN